METARAMQILSALSNGVDPFSGETLPASSPCRHPDLVSALIHAVQQLQAVAQPCPTIPERPLASGNPGETTADRRTDTTAQRRRNAGKPWSPGDDARLGEGFDAGRDVDTLAAEHGRSRLAIEIRLAKLGRLPMPSKTLYGPAPASPAPEAREPAWARYAISV